MDRLRFLNFATRKKGAAWWWAGTRGGAARSARSWPWPLAAVLLLAFGCAPPASLRPLGAFPLARSAEVGAAFAAVGPRPYAAEKWQPVGQVWSSFKLSKSWDVSAITAFDASAFALGGAAKVAFMQDSRLSLGAEAELGWLWVALAMHASLRIVDELRIYAAPRFGTWGSEWTPGIPVGLSVPLFDGLLLRAEGQVNWAAFKYYNRRVLVAGGLGYQW